MLIRLLYAFRVLARLFWLSVTPSLDLYGLQDDGSGALSFPYSLNYGEGPLLDQAVRILDLQNVYRSDLLAPPVTISNYPPVFVLVQAPLVWLFGPEYWYGRAISLASAVATAVFNALTLHALTRDRIAAVAGLRAGWHLRPDEGLPPEGVRGATSLSLPLRRA